MSVDPSSTQLATREDAKTLRDQESILVLLNLGLLTAIAVVHVLFGPALGPPSRGFFALLMGRFLMQTLELAWLNGGQAPPDSRALRAYAGVSIWVNIAFAFALALLGGKEDTHYVVLIVIPVIAAAFRYGAVGIAVVVAATTSVTYLEVWIYYRRHLPRSGRPSTSRRRTSLSSTSSWPRSWRCWWATCGGSRGGCATPWPSSSAPATASCARRSSPRSAGSPARSRTRCATRSR